ncbi:hypothetical protein FBU30_000907 [Linnemannia zychae]|nr:hypothetical protein FBU30_000907 [Linnemannia zychae]
MADAVAPPTRAMLAVEKTRNKPSRSSTDTQSTLLTITKHGVIRWAGSSPSTIDATILQPSNESASESDPQEASDATTPQSEPADDAPQQQQQQQQQTEVSTSVTTAEAVAALPKQVFSLFLSPEQRKKKQEAEAAAATSLEAAKASGKKGRKPKGKLPSGTPLTSGSTTSGSILTSGIAKPPVDPKTIVDPNISKTGDTHRFFQEVKASQQNAAGLAAAGLASDGGSTGRTVRRYNSKPQESPLPLRHQQFHGSETIDAISGTIGGSSGQDVSSYNAAPSSTSLLRDPHTRHRIFGWYSLRTSLDLGITAPEYKSSSRGKDGWIHWGKNRDIKWREWSEKSHRLPRPTIKEKKILNQPSDPSEFESCRRVGENERLWHQTWATTLLSATGIEPGAVEIPGELKYGELWTEKYQPKQGADVLGNRSNTEYLTQWLKGLEVSGWSLNPEESQSNNAGSNKKSFDIIGAARKRRKRAKRKDMSDMNDFIVYDDLDDFEEPYGYQSEEEEIEFQVQKPLTSFSLLANLDPIDEEYGSTTGSKTLPKKFDIKSNTILLSGPTGSCKTAAIYACAEENGYEVFEVSPGMRRTGKEVLGLVGEMAENHHVHVVSGKSEVKEDAHSILSGKRQNSPAPALVPAPAPVKKSTIHSFFQPSKKVAQDEDEVMEAVSEEDVDIEGMDEDNAQATQENVDGQQIRPLSSFTSSPSSTPTPSTAKEVDGEDIEQGDSLAHHEDTLSDLYSLLSTTNPRQSLILLEEVDILFEDDKGFWASIVTLISKSKRPVVMTCNDPSKIPPSMIRFQEHLEFTRPGMRELHLYLTSVCKIEGYICSSEYVIGVIKQNQYDVRKCLMQLQYDSGIVKSRSMLSKSNGINSTGASQGISSAITTLNGSGIGITQYSASGRSDGSESGRSSPTLGSPMRRKPQRLLRISAKGIIPASAPTIASEATKTLPSPMQELEQLEIQLQYANTMSLSDSCLRMKTDRILQCFEADQYEASKDDIVGQYFPIFKRPSGTDHLLMDQEIAALVEEGCESLYLNMINQQGTEPGHIFESSGIDPVESMTNNFVHKNSHMSRTLLNMQPALEMTLPLHGLRFNLGVTFDTYAPLIRSMIQADAVNTVIPTGKRTMRSGGHLKRHMNTLSEAENQTMLLTCFPTSSLAAIPHSASTFNPSLSTLPSASSSSSPSASSPSASSPFPTINS